MRAGVEMYICVARDFKVAARLNYDCAHLNMWVNVKDHHHTYCTYTSGKVL